jgi:hypothetical protein
MQERKFTLCQQNLATALQQVQDSECALQQVVSTLNEKVKALAGKDERFVLFLESFGSSNYSSAWKIWNKCFG